MSTDDRVPPCDVQAEGAVISAVLLHPESASEAFSVVQPEHFYSDANRQICAALLELFQQGKTIDILTVRSWLTERDKLQRIGGAKYLAEILDCVPAITNVGVYASIVRDKWRKRQIIATCQMFAAQGYGHVGTSQELCDEVEAAVSSIARDEVDIGVHPLSVAVDAAYKRIQVASQSGGGRTGVPTGIPRLDDLTGGWQATDLIVLAARPGVGKTALAMHQALVVGSFHGSVFGEPEAPAGVASLVFSLEMPEAQLAMRLICMESGCDLSEVRKGMVPKTWWPRLTAAAGSLHKVRMFIDDQTGLPVFAMRSKVMRTKAELQKKGMRLGLVVVDYLQKMTTRDPSLHSRAEVVGAIARGLKDIARDAEVPVMALSQLNRSSEQGSRRPQLSDLRESGDIEQEADVVAFLYDPNGPTKPDKNKGDEENRAQAKADARKPRKIELLIEKQRNGPVGSVKLGFIAGCTKFAELTDEYDDD